MNTDDLPNELLVHICSFLGQDELWNVIYVSSRFRWVASISFLQSHLGVGQNDIQAGTVRLVSGHPLHILLVVAHLYPVPIRKLVLDYDGSAKPDLDRLGSILGVLPAPIEDIYIHDTFDYTTSRRILANLPRVATDTLIVIRNTSIRISHPRVVPHIPWVSLPPRSPSSSISASDLLVSAALNCGILCGWVCERLLGRTWAPEERISEATGVLIYRDWIRVQTLPGRCTLITFPTRWGGGESGGCSGVDMMSLDLSVRGMKEEGGRTVSTRTI